MATRLKTPCWLALAILVANQVPISAQEELPPPIEVDPLKESVSILESPSTSVLEPDTATVPDQAPEFPQPLGPVRNDSNVTIAPGELDGYNPNVAPGPATLEANYEQEIEVLMQGPVHEAFAIPSDDILSQMPVSPEAPPAPVAEQPPELRPEGNNVQWIPGYWSWDEETSNFVWVSGLYRDVPPDRVWISGYWAESSEGYVWSSGFWGATEQIEYLPEPPASIDNGPSTPAPEPDSFWLPGQWVYDGNDYQWQSGYWTHQPDNWLWQSSCYVPTSNGYVYVSGYWDYEPTLRGIPYAPVVFRSPIYLRPGYRFRPVHRIARASSILLHLFVRAGYPGYYYGDYYAGRYANLGYRPWYRTSLPSYNSASYLSYYQWKYGRYGIPFAQSMSRFDQFVRSTPAARPAPRIAVQRPRVSASAIVPASPFGNTFEATVRHLAVASSLSVPRTSSSAALRIQTFPPTVTGSRTGGLRITPAQNTLTPRVATAGSSSSIVPRSISPLNVTPSLVAPRVVAPNVVAPRTISPRTVTPRVITPRTVTSSPLTARPPTIAPGGFPPRGISPRAFSPSTSPFRTMPPSMSISPLSRFPQTVRPMPTPRIAPPTFSPGLRPGSLGRSRDPVGSGGRLPGLGRRR